MKVLIISKYGDGLSIGHQLIKENHSVKMYIQEPQYKNSGVGIVERVDSWRPAIVWADLVIVDMVGFGKYLKVIEAKNKPVLGCNPLCDLIELDREKGLELFQKFGIRTPKSWYFRDVKSFKFSSFPKSNIVLKPSGNIDTAKTYVCEDESTTEYALSTYDPNQEFLAQVMVEGVEISTEGWFNGRDWIKPFNHTFEEKRFMNNNLGPYTGCMGNVVFVSEGNRLIEETLLKLTPFLRKISYRGPFDINCIVNEDGPHALEVTSRFGYDAIEALMEGMMEPVGDVLFEVANGTKKTIKMSNDMMIAVRMSVPPYPHDEPATEDEGIPIIGINKGNMDHIFLTDVYKKGKNYFAAMGDGVLLKATAYGRTVSEAQKRVYRTLDNIKVLGKQYRTDIGRRVEREVAELKGLGYL